ncbi:MAG: 4'-phosphopantetheinyl transferase superfamily protein, partial [Oscillospiraceae bacterium]|nr:4'-phosphopantetheinyl transferase superfamily protein [Oscillospiraceae bacterium]
MIRDDIQMLSSALALDEIGLYRADTANNQLNMDMYFRLPAAQKRRIERLPEALRPIRTASAYLICSRLSALSGLDISEIEFSYGPYGKPYCRDTNISFSLSHSGDLILYALGRRPLGVDVEYIRPVKSGLIPWLCSPEELEYLSGSGDEAALRRFFGLWTRKEAFIKTRGLSIADIRKLHFDFLDGSPVFPNGRYYFERLELGEKVCAALCIE